MQEGDVLKNQTWVFLKTQCWKNEGCGFCYEDSSEKALPPPHHLRSQEPSLALHSRPCCWEEFRQGTHHTNLCELVYRQETGPSFSPHVTSTPFSKCQPQASRLFRRCPGVEHRESKDTRGAGGRAWTIMQERCTDAWCSHTTELLPRGEHHQLKRGGGGRACRTLDRCCARKLCPPPFLDTHG